MEYALEARLERRAGVAVGEPRGAAHVSRSVNEHRDKALAGQKGLSGLEPGGGTAAGGVAQREPPAVEQLHVPGSSCNPLPTTRINVLWNVRGLGHPVKHQKGLRCRCANA